MRQNKVERIIELKMTALEKCRERIRETRSRREHSLGARERAVPMYGVTSALKHRHGL